jgi:alpha-L-rhamnosidase
MPTARYNRLYEQIRADFQRHFYDPATRTVKNKGSCQAANAAALCIGLIPVTDRAAMPQRHRRRPRITRLEADPGEVLQIFLIRALAENGRGDVLHRIYSRDDIPSYGHMVKSGLTTLPESWDARAARATVSTTSCSAISWSGTTPTSRASARRPEAWAGRR